MSIEIDTRNLAKWLNEEQTEPIDKQALARVLAHVQMADQPAQQEPVAWMDIDENGTFSGLRYWSEPDNRHEVALYTSKQQNKQWVGLTEQERNDLEDYCEMIIGKAAFDAIEAKLRSKNT